MTAVPALGPDRHHRASVTRRGGVLPAATGYRPMYESGVACPGCTSRAWHVGRRSAECARCGTALPLAPEEPAHG